jgi:diacylglycerol kinase family enzyme
VKSIAIIANPKAGSGRALEKLHEARRLFWGDRYRFFMPSSQEELRQVCGKLDPEDYEAAVVLGGDGTMNLAIQEFSKRSSAQIPLYPFPVGTANDLSSELDTPGDWLLVEELISSGRSERIDLIRVNGVPFATVAGIGIGASLTAELNERRDHSLALRVALKHLKKPLYSVLTLKTIALEPQLSRELILDAGHFRQRLRTAALFVCNQDRLGGNLQVGAGNDNTDNRFNVLVAQTSSRIKLASALAQLNLGKIPEDFVAFSTTHLTVECPKGRPIRVFGDGETLFEAPRLVFEIESKGLRVFRGRRKKSRARKEDSR